MLELMKTQSSRPDNVKGSAHGGRIILHQRIATAIGIKEGSLETSRSILIKLSDYDGSQDIAISAAVALHVAAAKNEDQAAEIGVATHREIAGDD